MADSFGSSSDRWYAVPPRRWSSLALSLLYNTSNGFFDEEMSLEPPEIVEVEDAAQDVSCDGGALFGHPRVYLTFAGKDYVDCYYCGRRFVRPFSVAKRSVSNKDADAA